MSISPKLIVSGSTASRQRIRCGAAGEFYVRLWEESAGGSREEVLQLAGRFGPVIGGFDAAILVSTTLILPA